MPNGKENMDFVNRRDFLNYQKTSGQQYDQLMKLNDNFNIFSGKDHEKPRNFRKHETSTGSLWGNNNQHNHPNNQRNRKTQRTSNQRGLSVRDTDTLSRNISPHMPSQTSLQNSHSDIAQGQNSINARNRNSNASNFNQTQNRESQNIPQQRMAAAFSDGKVFLIAKESGGFGPMPILDLKAPITNLLETESEIIATTAEGILVRFDVRNFQEITRTKSHVSSIINCFRVRKLSDLVSTFADKNLFPTGSDAFVLKKDNPDSIISYKNMQTFSISGKVRQREYMPGGRTKGGQRRQGERDPEGAGALMYGGQQGRSQRGSNGFDQTGSQGFPSRKPAQEGQHRQHQGYASHSRQHKQNGRQGQNTRISDTLDRFASQFTPKSTPKTNQNSNLPQTVMKRLDTEEKNALRASLAKKQFAFIDLLDKQVFNEDSPMIVSLDRKGKALFWQIESHQNDKHQINSRRKVQHSDTDSGLKQGQNLVNIGEWQVCIRDRGDIVASAAFENVVMVGFETGHVALFYLGMRQPFVEFNSGSYTVKKLLFSQVSIKIIITGRYIRCGKRSKRKFKSYLFWIEKTPQAFLLTYKNRGNGKILKFRADKLFAFRQIPKSKLSNL